MPLSFRRRALVALLRCSSLAVSAQVQKAVRWPISAASRRLQHS